MKWIFVYIFIILQNVLGFTTINGIIPYKKPYYISSKISDTHKLWITDAMNIINPITKLDTQDYYDNNCIRIRYDTTTYAGFSDFEGYLLNDNRWLVDKINIGINPNIEFYNTFVSIMTHELLHSIGCMHSDVFDSIMNITVIVVNDKVQDTEYPMLHQDDIKCIQSVLI